MTSVHGPYSIIYYDCEQHVLWVGRDPIGRISLLWNISADKLIVTSVGHKDIANLEEVPAIGLFKFDLNANSLGMNVLHIVRVSLALSLIITFLF